MTERQTNRTDDERLKKFSASRTGPFLFLLAGLSVLSGFLLSKINIIGRAGIELFYNEYRFFKYWWKGALAVFGILLFLFYLQGFIQQKLFRTHAALLHISALVIAVVGVYFTYDNFRHDLSHRLIGERFHLGFYLFWFGWMLISLFYLFGKRREVML